ncbi:hypothetical protein HWV62_14950 [Athelia sp. TMB]|nr:hypothetical protein HWV62_14950 [Athelia sp. TMB]
MVPFAKLLAVSLPWIIACFSATIEKRATPTLWLVGDSTMALHAASEGIQGAVSGSSARSYARDGRFYNVIQEVKSGDYVIIEFGHNDGGGNVATLNTADLVGESLTATQTVTLANGSTEVVYTYAYYVLYLLTSDAAAAKGVAYVDHFTAAVSLFSKYDAATVNSYYPLDQYLHTNTASATQMAWAFLSVGKGAGARCSYP